MTPEEQSKFEVPKDYYELKAGDVRQEGDYFWSIHSNAWKATKEIGREITKFNLSRLRFIRKAERKPTYNENYGTW